MTGPLTADSAAARPQRFLDPGISAFDHALEHGALVRMRTAPPEGGPVSLSGNQVLHFQYNAETITRTRQGNWEARRQRRPGTPAPSERTSRGAHGSGAVNAESEQISLKLVFDASEAILTGRPEAQTTGILPELAFFEITAQAKEIPDGTANQRLGAQPAHPIRPDELLLVLGGSRTFPVVLTSLTITEQKFTPQLVPIRAEVDIRLTVLEPGESAYTGWISRAFDDLVRQRTTNADRVTGRSALDAVTRSLEQSWQRTAGPAPAAGGPR